MGCVYWGTISYQRVCYSCSSQVNFLAFTVKPTPAVQPPVKPTPAVQPPVKPTPAVQPPVKPTPAVQPPVKPTPAVDPVEPEVEEDCPKQRAAFSALELPISSPAFEEGNCFFKAKQCEGEKCICVKAKSGERQYGNVVVPSNHPYDCESK